MRYTAVRTHEIHCGHRVVGHGGKCVNLHGHGYVFEFHCQPEKGLDNLGMVVDFSVIKSRLCQWLEDNWDHRMLIWSKDPWLGALRAIDDTVTAVPFNPTAENIAGHMVEVVAPDVLQGTGASLVRCVVHETGKCRAEAER